MPNDPKKKKNEAFRLLFLLIEIQWKIHWASPQETGLTSTTRQIWPRAPLTSHSGDNHSEGTSHVLGDQEILPEP